MNNEVVQLSFWKWRNYLSKIGHVILKMLMVDQRPKMELLLMSPPASGEQVGTMWNSKTLASIPALNVTVFNAWGRGMQNNSVWRMWMFWKSAGPLFSTTVLCGWGGCIPLIQCNGFQNSGEGLSENAATDKYSCSKKRANKEMLKSLKAYK